MFKIIQLLCLFLCVTIPVEAKTVVDALGRNVNVPDKVEHIVCSGSGALRLITYLHASDMVVAVDDGETRERDIDPRPYVMAYPKYKTMPVFGAMSGGDNPELILALNPMPDLIIKTNTPGRGLDPVELEKKTGIPVLVIDYGDLADNRPTLYKSMLLLGDVLGKQERAQGVVSFFENEISQLQDRTKNIKDKKTAYAGGIAWSGSHGLEATEPKYPPFGFVNVINIAYDDKKTTPDASHTKISKEIIIDKDPEYIFLDLATTHNGAESGGLFELKTDKAYQTLSAIKNNKVYGLLPYTWVNNNYETILADAWFIGKTIYPDLFADIEIDKKTDEIMEFLVGKKLYADLAGLYPNLAFEQIKIKE